MCLHIPLYLITGEDVEILCDEDNTFKGILFQDKQMLDAFQAYPEIVFINATYKLLELGLPTYIMLCEEIPMARVKL